jgi:hypothetical protein
MNLVTGFWSNIFQFKENYYDVNSAFVSDPSWWVGFNSFNVANPVVNMTCWGGAHVGPTTPLPPLYDKWTKFEYRLYQGDRLEVYIDDVLFDTGLQSTYPVGRMDFTGQVGSNGQVVSQPLSWNFGAGNYTNGGDYPAAASGIYVDLACLLPLP